MNGESILDRIPFALDGAALARKVRLEPGSGFEGDLERLAREGGALARPRALCRLEFPELTGEDRVTIAGVELKSRVLRVNLEKAHRVFLYVATCGMELEEWAWSKEDPLERYWAEAVKELALGEAVKAMHQDLEARYRPGPTAAMSPGSLADWPIQQQRPLFAILGDVQAKIGVQLSASYLMIPNKTISGLRFPTQERYENCLLCPRPDCPNRRAPYDPELYDRKYGIREEHPGG
jgi:hypothetical protein